MRGHTSQWCGIDHAPLAHTSICVQALPSLQALVLLVWTHPVAVLHVSVVHGLASSQFTNVPPLQLLGVPLPSHASPAVQASPSLHRVPECVGSCEHAQDAPAA